MPIEKLNSGHKNQFLGLTVLLVDNIDDTNSTIANMLNTMGFSNIIHATNGSHALNMLFQQEVNLILTAPQLPKDEGLQLLKQSKISPKTSKIPFVIIAETIDQEQVLEAIKYGVSEYIIKPFSEKQFVNQLTKAIFDLNSSAIKKLSSLTKKNTQMASNKSSQQPLQILVVDDVIDNIKVISEILRKDYKVKAATSGEKALQICSMDPQPDLVLLDIMMPIMDGMEVCRRLKANSKTQHITVIFLSALDQTKHIVQGLELGAVDYITKPIDPPLVKARVRTHCKIIESNKLMRNQIDIMQENARLKEAFELIKQKGYQTGSSSVRKRI
ncbi:MAG: response regulator [Colwellia sp.]|nr:response regulator [Colwellia sp.]